MWKAALEDDEFLVEDADDLLPDSEPGSPSSFIASLQRDGLTTVPEDELSTSSAQQAQRSPRDDRTPSTRTHRISLWLPICYTCRLILQHTTTLVWLVLVYLNTHCSGPRANKDRHHPSQ